MTYYEFETAVLAILNAKPAGTWMRLGTGFLGVEGGGTVLCTPEPDAPVPDMLAWIEDNIGQTDESAWNGDAFDGMTADEIHAALENPEFHLFGVPG